MYALKTTKTKRRSRNILIEASKHSIYDIWEGINGSYYSHVKRPKTQPPNRVVPNILREKPDTNLNLLVDPNRIIRFNSCLSV